MDAIERARWAFAQGEWQVAFSRFTALAESTSLEVADHERLAVCAYLVGEDKECAAAWEAAQRAALEDGDRAGSARCAFWLAMCLMVQGQMAQAGGWLTRAQRLIELAKLDCAASGYLLIPRLLSALDGGDPTTALDLAVEATALGNRFDDADLRAFGTLGHGQALIAMGDTTGGTARLDEVMVSVTAREVGPITSGIVYCAVILECMQVFDVQRASEWTNALSAWCDAQPDLVPYRGQCLVHRSQLLQAAGDWPDAITTAQAACQRLIDPPHPALGLAYYQEAELHRLVGAFEEAETEYRQASRNGYQPMPGLALFELARGDARAAAASVQRALNEVRNPRDRPALLAAAVDILRTTGDLPGARSASEDLAAIAAPSSSGVLGAMAAQATGTVLVAEGDPASALIELRAAATTWQSLHMPYEAARVGVMRGLACAALGDQTSADLELEIARDIFTELGALPDLGRLATLSSGLVESAIPPPEVVGSGKLSTREREVLAHVAAGETNREIATRLFISEHTVGPSPGEHLHQAGRDEPGRGHRLRLQTPPRLRPTRGTRWPHRAFAPLARVGGNGAFGRCPAFGFIRTVFTSENDADQNIGAGPDMTAQTRTATLDRDTADRLSAGFHRCFSAFEADDDLFASESFFDLLPPMWRFQLEGSGDDFTAQLRSIADGPVAIEVVRTVPTATGFVTEHVETQHTPGGPITARRIHLCEVRDGRICAVTTYCNGGWDDELRARHAAEAPMIRP